MIGGSHMVSRWYRDLAGPTDFASIRGMVPQAAAFRSRRHVDFKRQAGALCSVPALPVC
jgi:hypothetical protein